MVAQEGGFHRLSEWGAGGVVEELLAEQDRHDPSDHHPPTEPARDAIQQAVAADVFLRFGVRRGLHQHEGADPVGMAQREPHPDEAPHREADEMTRGASQCRDQRSGVCGQRVHVVTGRGDLALTLTAEIERDAAKALLEHGDLAVEHASAPQEAMGKDNRLWPGSPFLIIEAGSVQRQVGHGELRYAGKGWIKERFAFPPQRVRVRLEPGIEQIEFGQFTPGLLRMGCLRYLPALMAVIHPQAGGWGAASVAGRNRAASCVASQAVRA